LELALQLASKIWLIPSKSQEVLEGCPEDLVLEGKFAHIFDSQKINFDSSRGSFRIQTPKKRKIGLKAEGKYFFWTQNALARIGFELEENKNNQIIFDLKKQVWKYESTQTQETFESIEKLLAYLKN